MGKVVFCMWKGSEMIAGVVESENGFVPLFMGFCISDERERERVASFQQTIP